MVDHLRASSLLFALFRQAFANLPDAPAFGGLSSIALIEGKSGKKRIKSAKQAGAVAKAAIKALTALKLAQGIG